MRATILHFRIAVIALICYWIALFVGTHMPAKFVSVMHSSDKLMHTGAYCGLAFILAWAIPTSSKQLWRNVLFAFVIAIAYAAFDELTQIPVGRTADWFDFFADITGTVIGLGSYSLARYVIIRNHWRIFS